MTEPRTEAGKRLLASKVLSDRVTPELRQTILDIEAEAALPVPALSREALEEAVSNALSAATEGGEFTEAPEPSDEPGSPYVKAIAASLAASGAALPVPALDAPDDWETFRMDQRWPTPIHMRLAADSLDQLVIPKYGDILRWVADACDRALTGPRRPKERRDAMSDLREYLRTVLCDACGHHLHRPQPCTWTVGAGRHETLCPCAALPVPALDALRTMSEAATPGPWQPYIAYSGESGTPDEVGIYAGAGTTHHGSENTVITDFSLYAGEALLDLEFIAAAVNYVRAALGGGQP